MKNVTKTIEMLNSEIQVNEKIGKTSAMELHKTKESICNEISSKLSPIFNLGEDWVLTFSEESLQIDEKENPRGWGSGNVYFRKDWRREDEMGAFHDKIEINFSSASGDDLPTLKRVVMQGKVAEAIMNHSEDMLVALNEIHNKYRMEAKKWRHIHYTAEREVIKLKEEKERLEMNLLMDQVAANGIEFSSVENRYGDQVYPKFQVNERYVISNIVGCEITNTTPSGKMVDVKITYFTREYDYEIHQWKESKNHQAIIVRVTTEKVVNFLEFYKKQIRHSDES
jgi:hypothetical protein